MESLASCVVCPHVDEGTADKLDLSGVVCVGRIGVVCPHVDEGGQTSCECSDVIYPHVDEELIRRSSCRVSTALV